MNKKIVLFVGGVGGAKLAVGLAKSVPPESLTVVVNTGDDFWHYGLRICPDLDTITYTLSGEVNPVHGWGMANDTTHTLNALKRLGDTPWFTLGDRDLATHMLRTRLWHEGQTLSEITQVLSSAYGIQCTILPMTDVPVATRVDTVEQGELAFQVYFVKHRWQPTVRQIRVDNIENATISEAVQTAVEQADIILIGPSNPWLSIQPILSVPGMRELISSRQVPRVAVAPIVDGKAIKGPTAKIMTELGIDVSTQAVMDYYGTVLNGYVYDERDHSLTTDHVRTVAFDTIMRTEDDKIALAQHVLNWVESW